MISLTAMVIIRTTTTIFVMINVSTISIIALIIPSHTLDHYCIISIVVSIIYYTVFIVCFTMIRIFIMLTIRLMLT